MDALLTPRGSGHEPRLSRLNWCFFLLIKDLHSTVLRFWAPARSVAHLDADPYPSGSY